MLTLISTPSRVSTERRLSLACMISFQLLVVNSDGPVFRLDLDFIRGGDELGAQAERFPLQQGIDEVHGLTSLLPVTAVGDLSGVKLQGQPVNGNCFHGALSLTTCLIKRARVSISGGSL